MASKQAASKQLGKKIEKKQESTKGEVGVKATQSRSAGGFPSRGAKTLWPDKLPKPPVDPARLNDVVEFTMKTRWGIHKGKGTVVKLPYTDDEHQHRLTVRVSETELAHPFPSQCRVVVRAITYTNAAKETDK